MEGLSGGSGAGAARGGGEGEPGSAREILVQGRKLLSSPAPGATNKFVITEAEAWFLPLEEGETAPPALAEVLLAVFGGELGNEDFVEELDARLEDGRILLGYVLKGGKVEVHCFVSTPNPATHARLREVLGREVEEIGDDPIGGSARPDAEGMR